MKSQVIDIKGVYIFVAKTTKSKIHEKSTSCEAAPPVNAYVRIDAMLRVRHRGVRLGINRLKPHLA